mgnify:CR=1 FL=1
MSGSAARFCLAPERPLQLRRPFRGVVSRAFDDRSRWRAAVVLWTLLLLPGCGGDSTHTAPGFRETVLLSGQSRPTPDGPQSAVIRRLSGGTWSETSLPPALRGRISGLAYSDSETVWAWTAGGESAGLVLRSIDDGRSFEVARDFVPDGGTYGPPSICDLLFVSPSEAWLLTEGHGALINPLSSSLVFHTGSSGESWESTALADLEDVPATSGACSAPWNGAALLERGGRVELVRNPMGALDSPRPTRIHELPDPEGALVRPAAEQFFATASASFGGRGWIAGVLDAGGGGSPKRAGRLGIVTATGDSTWEHQPLPDCPRCLLARMEFASELRGLACGHRSEQSACDRAPLCLFTRDGGATWREGRMPDGLRGLRVATLVLSSDGSRALATADNQDCGDDTGARGALLESADGGMSWQASAPPVEGLYASDLVRSVAR